MSDPRCPLCSEPVTPGQAWHAELIGTPDGDRPAHRECLLRSVMGGIGHIEDHAYWCLQRHDPDGGRTYRQSALEVAAWLAQHPEGRT